MTETPTLWSFIASADAVVKLVLFVLMAASVFSWTIILNSYRRLKMAKEDADRFESAFWSGINLHDHHETLDARTRLTGLAAIFHSGFSEFITKTAALGQVEQRLARVTRAMRTTQVRTTEQLIGRSDWLATIGSISPYVGLFGTVWGIMSAFRSLGQVAQASIAMVAPGIAEALIATAIGLFVAIPAVVAYNRLSAKIAVLETRYDNFQDELLNVLHQDSSSVGDPA